ncbi:DUF3363 domain-containing protein [Mesorhizobium sp. M0984]|uniref:DUF3363 domain-containing protein n=1 Tax=Mesorhizobium sp. M0984 TaxID=2957041 RepID=UPI003336E406
MLGPVSLASGRFAMLDNGLGFRLVPWQPMLEGRIGQHHRPRAKQRRHRLELRQKARNRDVTAEVWCSPRPFLLQVPLPRSTRNSVAPSVRALRISPPFRAASERIVFGPDELLLAHLLRSSAPSLPSDQSSAAPTGRIRNCGFR